MRILPNEATFHEAVNIFPAMSDAEFRELVDDMREHGQREPVWVLADGRVIDGRNRVKACAELGRSVDARVYHGNETSVEAFVVSLNLKRRHLSEEQRAMVAGRLANLKEGRPQKTAPIGAVVSQPDAAELLNVSRRSVQRAVAVQRDGTPELIAAVDAGDVSVSAAAEVATLPEDEQREVVARGEKEILTRAKEIRAAKHRAHKQERIERVKTMDWPDGIYRIVYADPPWQYENSGMRHSAAQHYETMPVSAICDMPVNDLAADDAVLFLWATSPLLPEALRVIEAWGFQYKASFVWDKARPNYGNYNAVRHEFLLVAVKGNCVPEIDERLPSIVCLERTGRHSEKPVEFRQMIDRLYPHGPRIELFAREKHEGWQAWGNELTTLPEEKHQAEVKRQHEPRDPFDTPKKVERPIEPDSPALLQLKRHWRRTKKADKTAFRAWAGEQLGETPKAKLQ